MALVPIVTMCPVNDLGFSVAGMQSNIGFGSHCGTVVPTMTFPFIVIRFFNNGPRSCRLKTCWEEREREIRTD